MDRESWIEEALADLREKSAERRDVVRPRREGRILAGAGHALDFSSNDYLDLARNPTVVFSATEALRRVGAGAGASRLLSGTLDLHVELERRIAALKGYPAALLFGSGYLANAGILPAVVARGDLVFSDRLAHASLVDGAVLSRAEVRRFRHNDPEHLEELLREAPAGGRRLIVTESLFSMDGDIAPLRDLARVAMEHDALLLVDEAHATGVFGPGGSGIVRAEGLEGIVNLSMGTLSKALGGYGAFVASSHPFRNLLVNRARSFIYSTAPPPASAGAALGALDVLAAEPDLGARLLERAARLRERLAAAGLDTLGSRSQIVPVRIGENEKALAVAARLEAEGIIAPAIRPPTVPPGTARLRLSVTLAHSEEELERAVSAVIAAVQAEGIA